MAEYTKAKRRGDKPKEPRSVCEKLLCSSVDVRTLKLKVSCT